MYSDINLSFNTITFNLGDSLLLSGCKTCNAKDDKDVFSERNSSCQYCITRNLQFSCGNSFQILEKLNELEKANTCVTDRFGVRANGLSSYEWKNKTCDNDLDHCCVEIENNKESQNPLKSIDKHIVAFQPNYLKELRNKMGYDVYLLGGTSNFYHCERTRPSVLFQTNLDWYESNIESFIKQNITKVKKPNETEWFFKFKQAENGKTILEKGFDKRNDCGLYIVNRLKNHVENNGEGCGSNACLIHLLRLKWNLNISSVNDWKEKTFFSYGVKFGGQLCQPLQIYGFASLVPIFLNIIFNMFLFLEDLKLGQSMKIEVIFVLLAIYPQIKCLQFLFQFLVH